MSSEVLVSVVIPAFNAQEFIGAAMESVLRQTHGNLELIVIDDGSEDETSAAAAMVADGRTTIVRTANGGVARARNMGLAHASGAYVAFLDADDLWHSQKLSKQLKVAADGDRVAVGCRMRYIALDGRVLGATGVAVGPDTKQLVLEGRLMPFPVSSILFRRDVVQQLGGFDPYLSDHIPGLVEDIDLLARVAARGGLGFVDEPLGDYRVHGSSASAIHHASQRKGARFVRARLAAERRGEILTWEDFSSQYDLSLNQRRGDVVQCWYREAGLALADQRRAKAALRLVGAGVLGPRYTLSRLIRQLS